MYYYQIYLRNVRDFYTWESEKNIPLGSRVAVKFRNQKRIGIILERNKTKPEFQTQPVVEVLDEAFIDERYLDIAKEISAENFTRLTKALSLIVPEAFFLKRNPVKRHLSYQLNPDFEPPRGPKQKEAIQIIQKNGGEVSEKTLKEKISTTVLKNLLEKDIIKVIEGDIISETSFQKNSPKKIALNSEQKSVLADVMTNENPSVIWGVTGSGKTEIYKHLAKETLAKNPNAQVLLLLPEIALTPQLISEFSEFFGEQIAVWHSNMTKNEKVQAWERVRSGEAKVLIGTRSAVMTVALNPALIILDEEHEWTFKNEFNPRYWTHDWVEKIRQKFGSKLVFGSATPRLSTLHKVETDNYHLAELKHKVYQTKPPKISLVDLTQEGKKGNHTPLSEELVRQLRDIKKRGRQAVLFLNKRGYAGSTMCKACGTYFECPNCSANMKLHRTDNKQRLICHTCGHLEKFSEKCPHCHTTNFVFRGWGTQQVEAELATQLPDIKFLRADKDTVTGRYDFEKILEKFHQGQADVLLGTQMIAKGLDFENVELVGIVLADVGLSLPDFRAEERVFQLLTQVSGRAGRRKTAGKIIIQTFHPEEDIFKYLQEHNIQGFYENQKQQRQQNFFPPLAALAKITISDPDKKKAFTLGKKVTEMLKKSAENLKDKLQIQFAPAFFPRSHNKYHFHVFVRMKSKKNLLDFLNHHGFPPEARIDIDPVSLL